LNLSGVAGVMRRKVLEFFEANNTEVEVGDFSLMELLSADEVWMCNSLLGVAPVTSITAANNHKTVFPIGKLTQRLQGNLNT
ncbi:aminotransferase class IV, partial [Vibrio sp. 1567]